MGDNNNSAPPERGPRRDGTINFSRYSTEQLQELRDTLDPQAVPLNHAALLAELEVRAGEAAGQSEWQCRYTRRSGVLGWLAATWLRSPVYGQGSIAVERDTVRIRGWQLTWLAAPVERVLTFDLAKVLNVSGRSGNVRFEVRRRGWLRRRVDLQLDVSEQMDALLAALPQAKTRSFQKHGAALRAFEDQLRNRCSNAWLTPLLVLVNTLVFIAASLGGGVANIAASGITFRTANIGPLTLSGDWWRLLSTLFIHGSVLHLALNMWVLWNVGRLTERMYGRWHFLALYLLSGAIASTSTLLWNPAISSVGASGAIFGLFGAFLACFARRDAGVPRGVFRSHWIPSLLFVTFNLISGATTPEIDNAAHVGGLLGGALLGFATFRPFTETYSRTRMRLSWVAATAMCLGVIVVPIRALRADAVSTPVGQRFGATHQWFVTSETRNLVVWQQVAAQSAAGSLNNEQFGQRFERDILPFWQNAHPRLQAEVATLSGEDRRYVEEVATYAKLRLEWAQVLIELAREQDAERSAKAQEKMEQSTASVARLERLNMVSKASQPARGLVNLPQLRRLKAHLAGDQVDCVDEPAGSDFVLSPTDSRTDSPALAQQAACNAQRLFRDEDFASLDRMLEAGVLNIGDLPGGGSSFPAAVSGIDALMYYGSGTVDQYLQQLARWRRAVPGSPYPTLIEAMLFNNWAWSARGHGSVNQVNQQAWALFSYRNEMAHAALESARDDARRGLLGCQLSMQLAHDRAAGIDEIRKTFDKCLRDHPGYRPLYSSMLRSLQPRWYGSADAVRNFIEEMAAAAPEPERDTLYARLYWTYADVERDDVNIFQDSHADWDRVNAGFVDMETTFPGSDLVLNAYARMACLAGDKETYASLRNDVRRRYASSAWSRRISRAECDKRMRN